MQTVWNGLTRRAVDYGINDYDVFYFDPDTTWAAEDAVIRQLHDAFANLGVTVEMRNQARVHLWYPEKHGVPYPPLHSSTQGIDRFLTRNTQVGIRRTRNGHEVYAPHGYHDIANMIVRPNPGANFSAANYERKAARMEDVMAGDHGAAGRRRAASPHHAGRKARLAPRRFDLFLQEAMRVPCRHSPAGHRSRPGICCRRRRRPCRPHRPRRVLRSKFW